jgi:ADP-ribosylglycohydrolase
MRHFYICLVLTALLANLTSNAFAKQRPISKDELHDKINAFWLGQLVGNYIGLPFENNYVDEAIPELIDRIYSVEDDTKLEINEDWKGNIPLLFNYFEGAFADDDTDIEFVTLHAVEKYGLDIDYYEITEVWKKHINRKIWVANYSARQLMDQGLIAPATGSKNNNRNWFQIDPQLVNEIWSVFYPGMIHKAAERALWGARITNDDWGTHPTIAYGVMISAAFFEKDTEKLVQMALDAIPTDSPFAEGMNDVVMWHKKNDDWRETRKKIHEKYYRYKNGSYEAPVSVVSSLNNGLCGIMAILYGEGDFIKSVSIATTAGYDCDNQAATVGGLIGVINGTKCIPEKFTKSIADFDEPFNDLYINYTRDHLPIATPISEIVDRIAEISEKAILDNGGRVEVVRNNAPSIANKEVILNHLGINYTMKFAINEASISGGDFNEETFVEYVQDGDRLRWEIWDDETSLMKLEGYYDGKNIHSVKEIDVDIFEEDIYGEITYIINSDF